MHAGHVEASNGQVARIVWQTTEYERAALRTIDAMGRQHELAPQEWAPGPTLSPDGTRVAFTRIDPAGQGRLWVSNADGSEQHPIAPDGLGRTDMGFLPAVWSPDGTQILSTNAYYEDVGTSSHYAQRELYLLDARGQAAPRLLVRNSAGINWYVWAPDSTTIAYTDNGDGSVYVLDTVTMQRRRVTSGRVEDWSPDGRRLLIDDNPRLIEFDFATGQHEVILEQDALASPSYSPDGSLFGFAGFSDIEGQQSAMYVADRAGRKRALQHGKLTGPLRWGPDGGFYWRRHDNGLDENGRLAWTVQTHSTSDDRLDARQVPIGQSGIFDVSRALRRLAGVGRESTAAAVSRAQFPTSERVVLTRSDDYSDALASAPLAAVLEAPLLLTRPEALHPSTAREIERLDARRVTIVGSETAVSRAVEQDLTALGLSVERVSGADRFDTAAQIARRVGVDNSTAYLAAGVGTQSSSGWADAASISAVAAHQRRPILLGRRDAIPASTAAALRDLDVSAATVVGGQQAVSDGVVQSLRQMVAGQVDRLAGDDRYETSVLVAELGVAAGMSAQRPWITTGSAFPDALSAGPAAAAARSVSLLVAAGDRGTASSVWLRSTAREYVTVVGGPAAVTPGVAVAASGVRGP